MTESKRADTAVAPERWAVRFTWETTRAGITFPRYSFDRRLTSRQSATRYARSEWATRHHGVQVVAAHIRILPGGQWLAVEPASLCGAID